MVNVGDRIDGPDGQFYIVKKPIAIGGYLLPDMFEAHGGAPVPESGKYIPAWAMAALRNNVTSKP